MKKTLLAGLATLLFFLTSIGIAKDWPLAQEDMKNSKVTGLYDNVTILQEQINTLTERLGRIETLHEVGDRFTDKGDGTIKDNDTGLIWLKKANCFEWKNWSDAKAAAALLASPQCGLTDVSVPGDWKLPSKTEWEAFLSHVYRVPALVNTVGDGQWSEGDAFYDVMSARFWSRTAEDADSAWFADTGNGATDTNRKTEYAFMYLWPVRKEHRFKDMGDGTIRDNNSGLIWLKKANCFPYTMTWSDANAHAHSLQPPSCGLDDGSAAGDWRLPTKSEWLAFLGQTYWCPCLANTAGSGQWKEGDAFTGVQSYWHWSSTPTVFPDERVVAAVDGCGTWTDSVYFEHYLWPVRSPK